MSNAAILYLRLLRKIVRESAWRLGGGEETFLAGGYGGGDGSVICGGGEAPVADRMAARSVKPACGGRPRAGKARHGNRQTQDGKRNSKRWNRQTMEGNRHK